MSLATTQYLSTAGDSATLSITGDLTIEGWLLSESSLPDKSGRYVFGKYGVDGQRAYQVMLQHDEANLGQGEHLMLYVGPASASGTVFLQFGVPLSVATGTWAHVAVVYSASQVTASFYADGQLLDVKSGLPPALHDSTARFRIGALDTSNPSDLVGATWNGRISEVRVWSVARTAQEIDSTRLVTVSPQPGLQGYWPLNIDLLDATGNGNDLSAVNGAALVAGGPPVCGN